MPKRYDDHSIIPSPTRFFLSAYTATVGHVSEVRCKELYSTSAAYVCSYGCALSLCSSTDTAYVMSLSSHSSLFCGYTIFKSCLFRLIPGLLLVWLYFRFLSSARYHSFVFCCCVFVFNAWADHCAHLSSLACFFSVSQSDHRICISVESKPGRTPAVLMSLDRNTGLI